MIFRLGLDRNNQPEPDYDTVLQSKVDKGYKTGFIPIGDSDRNVIENYLQNQKPLRTGDFNRGVNKIIKHLTPGNVQQLAAQAGIPAAAVADQNQVQNQQDLNGVTPNFEGSAARNKRTKFNHIFDQETVTPSAPLMQHQNIPVKEMFASTPLMNRKPFASDDLDAFISKKTPPTLEYLQQRRHGSEIWEPFTPGSRYPDNKYSPATQDIWVDPPPKHRPPMKLSQKDIHEDYDAPTPHPLQRKADPQFNDRKLPPMIANNTTLASMMPPSAQPKSKKNKSSNIPLDTPLDNRPRTRSQGPVTPGQNLPGGLRKKY